MDILVIHGKIKHRIKDTIQRLHIWFLIHFQYYKYKWIARKLKKKSKITIAFFVVKSSTWKCDKLYQLLLSHPRFKPVLVICPVANYGRKNMIEEMDRCCDFFESKGYGYIRTYDVAADKYLDVRKEINPDILFYTNPYKSLIDNRYYITNFLDKLTCYVPYAFFAMEGIWTNNELLHNLVWRFYCETDFHKRQARNNTVGGGKNMVVSGYEGCNKEAQITITEPNEWICLGETKKIIVALHHIRLETFIKLKDIFFDIADEYQGKIHFAFKPHPLLKNKLKKEKGWSDEDITEYYQKWNEHPYCQLNEDSYTVLFSQSDALIHNCGSFLTEYLCTSKPSLYIIEPNFDGKHLNDTETLSEYGQRILDMHYQAKTINDIKKFIVDVVLNGNDIMKMDRMRFVENTIYPKGELDYAHVIIRDLEKNLCE